MRLRIKPEYGFGWFRTGETQSLDVPPEFDFEATVVECGTPFKTALGLVSEPGHLLTGLWVFLSLRTTGSEPTYNLRAYRERPSYPLDLRSHQPLITGFVIAYKFKP